MRVKMMSIFRNKYAKPKKKISNKYEKEEDDQDYFLRGHGASVLRHLKLEKIVQNLLRNLIQELKLQPAKETPISAGLHENAINKDGFTALHTFDVPQHSGKRDKDFNQIAEVAGTLRAKDLQNNNSDRVVLINWEDPNRTTTWKSNARLLSGMNLHVILLMATFFAIISFNAGLHPPGRCNEFREGYLSLIRLFVFFNSLVFFVSMAVIILLLQKYNFKPWPTLSAVPLLGSYVCSILAILPNQSRDVLFLSSSISLFVAAWMSSLGLCTSIV